MAFAVTINAERWRDHQDVVSDAVRRTAGSPLVPVIKGNGYGLGQRLLADEAIRLSADTVAVGTVFEVDKVAEYGTYDIIVLEPFDPRDTYASDAWWRLGQQLHSGRVIRTVSSVEDGVSVVRASGDGVAAAVAVARDLPEEIRRRVVTVEASTRNDVTLILKNGAEVMWGSAEEGPFKAEVLLVLLKEVDARYYDVSSPGVPATSDTPR